MRQRWDWPAPLLEAGLRDEVRLAAEPREEDRPWGHREARRGGGHREEDRPCGHREERRGGDHREERHGGDHREEERQAVDRQAAHPAAGHRGDRHRRREEEHQAEGLRIPGERLADILAGRPAGDHRAYRGAAPSVVHQAADRRVGVRRPPEAGQGEDRPEDPCPAARQEHREVCRMQCRRDWSGRWQYRNGGSSSCGNDTPDRASGDLLLFDDSGFFLMK